MSDSTTKIILDADARKLVQEFTQATSTLKNFAEQQKQAADASKSSWDATLTRLRDYSATLNNSLELMQKGAQMAKSVWDFAKEGAELAEAQKYFDAFTQSMGRSSDLFLKKMQESSSGLVTQKELMLATMKAARGGVAQDMDSLGKLWEIATVKADLMGVSVADAFRQMTDAISKGSSRTLIDLGILPESFSKASDKASLLEKRMILTTEVIKQGSEEVRKYAEVGDSAADKMERLSTAFTDVKEEAAKNLSEGLIPWVEFLTREGIPAIRDTVEWMNKLFFGIDRTEDYVKTTLEKNKLGAIESDLYQKRKELEKAKRIYKEELIYRPDSDSLNTRTGQAKANVKALEAIVKNLEEQKSSFLETFRNSKAVRDAEQKRAEAERLKRAEADLQSWIKNEYDPMIGGEEKKTSKIKSTAKSLKEARDAAIDYNKALKEVFETGRNSSINAIAPTFEEIAVKVKDTSAAFLQLGPGKLGVVRNFFEDAAEMAGTWSGNIEKAARELDKIDVNKLKEVSAQAQAYAFGVAGVAGMVPVPGGIFKTASTKNNEISYDFSEIESYRDFDRIVEDLHDKLQINVADAFEQGLYDGLNGGNFLESFGRGLRSQIARALSAGITSQIFGTGGSGGSFNLGGMLMGSPGYASGVPDFANTTAYDPSDGSGGNVLKGGLLSGIFKPAWSDAGKFLWKNALSNVGVGLVAGYAADRLFGAGGVFGGRIENGKEAIGQAGDVNSQVTQALAEQKQFLQTAVGVSAETFRQIRDLKFYTAGYTWSDSGDGIFSKKTRTYALDAGAANAALTEFQRLTKQATEESSKRTFEVSMTALNDPTKAATMGLNDLKEALARLTAGTEEYRNIQLQVAQGEKGLSDSRKQAQAQNLSNWTSYALGNPLAGYGSGMSPIPFDIWVNRPWSGGDWQSAKTSITNPVEEAEYAVKYGFTRPELTDGKYRVGNTELDATGLRTYIDSLVMMQGLKNQSGLAYEIAAAQARGEDLSTYKFQTSPLVQQPFTRTVIPGDQYKDGTSGPDRVLVSGGGITGGDFKTYGEILSGNLDYYQGIMDDLEKQLQNAALETEQRNQLFASWQQAQQAYYATRSEQLNFEIAEEAKIKAKQQKLNDDRLANALTWLGETREQNGQTVLILAGGQADTIERLKAIRDGLDAEGQAVINQIIDQKTASGATRWT